MMTSIGPKATPGGAGYAAMAPQDDADREGIERLHQHLRDQPGIARQQSMFLDAQRAAEPTRKRGGRRGAPAAEGAPAEASRRRRRPRPLTKRRRRTGGREREPGDDGPNPPSAARSGISHSRPRSRLRRRARKAAEDRAAKPPAIAPGPERQPPPRRRPKSATICETTRARRAPTRKNRFSARRKPRPAPISPAAASAG